MIAITNKNKNNKHGNKKVCNCKLCKITKKIDAFKSKLPKELLKEFDNISLELWNKMAIAEMDLAVLNSKITKTWPPSEDGKYYECIGIQLYEINSKLIVKLRSV